MNKFKMSIDERFVIPPQNNTQQAKSNFVKNEKQKYEWLRL